MAASKTFERAGASRSQRRFTLDEANRALPLVTRVVRDIVSTHERAVQLQGRMEELPSREANALQEQIDGMLDKLREYLEELEAIGVELKDYDSGLVDFLSRRQGRDVYLCWKLGEDKIEYWHELHTGYAGRKPVSSL